MRITKVWLEKYKACQSGMDWFEEQNETNLDKLFKLAVKDNKPDLINWFLSKKLSKIDCRKYAIYAAKQVLHIFEEKYPKDKRPKNAIKAAELCITNPSKKNKELMSAAFSAAFSAATSAANSAANSAAYYGAFSAAFSAATSAANSAAYSAADYAATSAANSAANFAAYYGAFSAANSGAFSAATSAAFYAAYSAAKEKLLLKIVKYGYKLLRS